MYPPDWDMFEIKGEWGDKAETMGVNQDRLRAAGPYHLVQQIHFQESAYRISPSQTSIFTGMFTVTKSVSTKS